MQKLNMNNWIRIAAGHSKPDAAPDAEAQEKKTPPAHAGNGARSAGPAVPPSMNEWIRHAAGR